MISLLSNCKREKKDHLFAIELPSDITQHWISPDFWGNRLDDWQLRQGRIECLHPKNQIRTLHILSREISRKRGKFTMEMQLGLINKKTQLKSGDFCGFLIACGDPELDTKDRMIVHNSYGKKGGIIAAIDGSGRLQFLDNCNGRQKLVFAEAEETRVGNWEKDEFVLRLIVEPLRDKYKMTLESHTLQGNELLNRVVISGIDSSNIVGNIALVAHSESKESNIAFWMNELECYGDKLNETSIKFGPVVACFYTVSGQQLRMTAQCVPLTQCEKAEAFLEVSEKGKNAWKEIVKSSVNPISYTAHFVVDQWNSNISYDFRISLKMKNLDQNSISGIIQAEPIDKATFSCVSFNNTSITQGILKTQYDFDKSNLNCFTDSFLKDILTKSPDMVIFNANQINENFPNPCKKDDNAQWDYLYKWYLFCMHWGKLCLQMPSILLPGSHDFFQPQLWGMENGKAPKSPLAGIYPFQHTGSEEYWQSDAGGFVMSQSFLEMVKATQCGHLPKFPDKSVSNHYFCNILYGGVDFAIIEDHSFKSAPYQLFPEAQICRGIPQNHSINRNLYNDGNGKLLGEAQMEFLENWVKTFNKTDFKVLLCNDNFATTYTHTPFVDSIVKSATSIMNIGQATVADMNTGAWPQNERNRLLSLIRKCHTFILTSGYPAKIVHHGISNFKDASLSIEVPPVYSEKKRYWMPSYSGSTYLSGIKVFTGDFLDAFSHKISISNLVNPTDTFIKQEKLKDQSNGFAILRFQKESQQLEVEFISIKGLKAIERATLESYQNFKFYYNAYLPILKINGLKSTPIIEIIDQKNQESIYKLKLPAYEFQPLAPAMGVFTIKIFDRENTKSQIFTDINATLSNNTTVINVSF